MTTINGSPPSVIDIEAVLREKIKPELNFLYTEQPFDAPGGHDFGWFCHEHAYLTFFVLRMLGVACTIKQGDIEIIDGQETGVSTFNTSGYHYWIHADNACPIDLSVTLQHIRPDLPSVPLIYGPGQAGEYLVNYEVEGGHTVKDDQGESQLIPIRYMERDKLHLTPAQLIEDPHTFVPRPKSRGLVDLLGGDIYERISVHLYRIARGEIGPYFSYVRPAKKAFRRIKDKNPEATDVIRRILALN